MLDAIFALGHRGLVLFKRCVKKILVRYVILVANFSLGSTILVEKVHATILIPQFRCLRSIPTDQDVMLLWKPEVVAR